MRPPFPLLLLLLAPGACGEERPAAPTAAEGERLDEAEAILDRMENEEGPEADAPDPTSNLN